MINYQNSLSKFLILSSIFVGIGVTVVANADATRLSPASKKELSTVHPDLQKVIRLASSMTGIQFIVYDGKRTMKEQVVHVKNGASKTFRSRHLTGHAVDLWIYKNGKVTWNAKEYAELNKVIQRAARQYGIKVEWGGNWKRFVDLPHWQLSRRQYP